MSSTENVNRRVYVTSRKTTMMSSEYRVSEGDEEQKGGRFCSPSADGKDSCSVSILFKLLVSVLCGMVFGIALHKAHGKWKYSSSNNRLLSTRLIDFYCMSALGVCAMHDNIIGLLPFV